MLESRAKQLLEQGRIEIPPTGKVPRYKRFLEEMKGTVVPNLWTDISPINSQAKDALGYPTQKPLELLERIIHISSNPGDVILDPFCGCGTAIAAAQKLNRHWIGIDITYLAISLQKYRLKDAFNIIPGKDYQVIGEPVDLTSAEQLASDNRYQFQWWACGMIGAMPIGGEQGDKKGKKGKDLGIDGKINFIDDAKGVPKSVMVQVKSGHVKAGDMRDLHGTIDRENAAIGVFITLEQPTSEMNKEALSAGYYTSELWQKDYPRIQILTVEQLFQGERVQMPPAHGTFKRAEKVKKNEGKQDELGI
jgi:site-specific DNA-methyltransferase (adenine-specific)